METQKKLGNAWVNHSVSWGTMRAEDLIPAFESVLEYAGVPVDRHTTEDPINAVIERMLDDKELSDEEWEQVSWYLNEDLFGALDDIAPEGCYFGASEGDGADYGFWTFADDSEEE